MFAKKKWRKGRRRNAKFTALRLRSFSLACLLFLLSFFYVTEVYAISWHELWRTPDQQAAKLLAAGEDEQAAALFENKNWQAVANYRAGDYQQALEGFAQEGNAQADYNRGNVLAHLGQYEQAIAAYDAALKEDPNNADALFNKQIVNQLLEQQQDQDQNDSQDQDQNQDQDQKQDDSDQQSPDQPQSNGDDEQSSNQQQQQDNASEDNDGSGDNGAQDDVPQAPQQPQELPQPPAGEQQDSANQQDMPQEQLPQQSFDDEDTNRQTQPAEQLEPLSGQQREQQNSAEQLLRQVPDDPGGLLRQKFLRDHLRKQQLER